MERSERARGTGEGWDKPGPPRSLPGREIRRVDAGGFVRFGALAEAIVERCEADVFHLSSLPDEEVALTLCILNPLAGDVEILGLAFNPDEVAACF